MIPLRQTEKLQSVGWVTRALVAMNVTAFLVQCISGTSGELLVRLFGFIPLRLFHPQLFGYSWIEAAVTLVTSLFLHGGVVHLIGNMLYLWVFGPAVEERLGKTRYVLFFLAAGIIGSLTHALLFRTSTIPSIGASGSIAGILGAFLVLRPRSRIVTLFPLIIYWALAEIPALLFVPLWFGVQFLSGWLALASARNVQEIAGVAWWAHVGGFLFGLAVAGVSRIRSPVIKATSSLTGDGE
jgi:membrane associated rhomboid family serine protease